MGRIPERKSVNKWQAHFKRTKQSLHRKIQGQGKRKTLKISSKPLSTILTFDDQNFRGLCNLLSGQDEDLKQIIDTYSYPPLWSREPTFETLIHFILEQQVSLASAKAALEKLRSLLGTISPVAVLSLSDEQMKNCYFSRQKIQYARSLANAIQSKSLCLSQLINQPSDIIRSELKKIKGIGDWTVDVFLLISLHYCDIFAAGDLALVNSLKQVKKLPAITSKENILKVAEQWRPYRSIATYLLWHAYLNRRK